MNPDCWCDYSAPSNEGRNHEDPINNPDGLIMILVISCDGAYLRPGILTSENKLDGEGPFRVVPPQKLPGPPDQSSKADDSTNPKKWVWPFDKNAVHNAGFAPRSATIIKIDPLPEGRTDIDPLEAGWNFVDEHKIMVYGSIDPVLTIDKKFADLVVFLNRLYPDEFKSYENKKIFILQTTNLRWAINRGMFRSAQNRPRSVLLKRVDGCKNADLPDGNDWLVNCCSQKQVYWTLYEVIVLLKITAK